MKKRLVAHLGAHKTATSLLQKYFKAKSSFYQAQGIKFLTRSQVSPYIAWGDRIVKNGAALQGFLKSEARMSRARTLMFSNENALGRTFPRREGLYPNHAQILEALKSATDGFDTHIVYGIRPQVDFLQSYYLQRIHQGEYMTFNQYVEKIDLDTISWAPIVECMKDQFGAENVTILDFRKIKQGQIAFIQDFLNAAVGAGIKVDEDYEDVHNPSISDRGLQIALRVNPLLKKSERSTMRAFLQANFSNLTDARPLLVSEELKAQLNDRYGAEYETLITR